MSNSYAIPKYSMNNLINFYQSYSADNQTKKSILDFLSHCAGENVETIIKSDEEEKKYTIEAVRLSIGFNRKLNFLDYVVPENFILKTGDGKVPVSFNHLDENIEENRMYIFQSCVDREYKNHKIFSDDRIELSELDVRLYKNTDLEIVNTVNMYLIMKNGEKIPVHTDNVTYKKIFVEEFEPVEITNCEGYME